MLLQQSRECALLDVNTSQTCLRRQRRKHGTLRSVGHATQLRRTSPHALVSFFALFCASPLYRAFVLQSVLPARLSKLSKVRWSVLSKLSIGWAVSGSAHASA